MIDKIKNMWEEVPEDIRQVVISLTVSLSLIFTAILALSSYVGQMERQTDDPSVMAQATETPESDAEV